MSKRYPGNFITGNPVALSQTSNNGVWDVKDVSAAVNAGTWQEPDGLYEIPRSLRFRRGAVAYLSRTPLAAGNRTSFTVSFWVKRCQLTAAFNEMFSVNNSGGGGDSISFRATTDTLQFATQGGTQTWLVTSAAFRDPNAWYHVVCVYDSNQAQASNRAKLFVNGVQPALGTSTYPSQGASATNYNTVQAHLIGSGYQLHDGYMTEFNFIDGQSLDASYFGYFDPITNIWQPKKYTGTYGTNGFYLPFNNAATTAALGWDYVQNPDPKFTFAQGSGMTFNTSTFKYGGSSMYFTGAAGGGTSFSGNSQYAIGTGQFCIEAWIYPETGHAGPAGNSFSTIISQGNNASNTLWALSLPDSTGANTTSRVQWGFTGATTISTATLTLNAWHHVMVSRDASNVERIFIDGVLVNQRTNTTNYNNVSGYNTNIGFMYDSNYPGAYGTSAYGNVMKGYINDLRLTIGAIPVPYQTSSVTTGTTIFTPPTSALPIGPQGISDPRYWNNVAFHIPFNGSGTSAFPVYAKGAFTTNGMDATPNFTAGDSYVDSPTNIFTSAPDTGGVVTGNYCTWDQLSLTMNSAAATLVNLSDGNCTADHGASAGNAAQMMVLSNMPMSTGRWYAEFTNLNNFQIGISRGRNRDSSGNTINNGIMINGDGTSVAYAVNGAAATIAGTGFTLSNTDVLGILVDADNNNCFFYKNGVYQTGATGITYTANSFDAGGWVFCKTAGTSSAGGNVAANFGQKPFSYPTAAVASGYKSLNTTNLQALGTSVVGKAGLQPNKWMDVSVWGGTSLQQQINNSGGFQPDLVWVKQRGAATEHSLYDAARGFAASLSSNTTAAEIDRASDKATITFNSSGFVAGADSAGYVNYVGRSYVGWQWKQSPTSGFNIITYTGSGTTQNITHNLGVTPSFIVVFRRDAIAGHKVIHSSLASSPTDYLELNAVNGVQNSTTPFGGIAPTSSTFTVGGSYADTNAAGATYVAYVWAGVPGFSKFGSYIGNGIADGTVVYTGFRPKYVMIKRATGGTSHWTILDTVRDTISNPTNNSLYANLNNTEDANATDQSIDILSNGFKVRAANNWETNTAGSQYVYAAFAESPFALNNRAK